MKLSTKSAAAMILLMGLATSCASDVETGINPDPQGNAINFAASVGRSARAAEIKIGNLGDFAVIARGLHPNGTLYDHYLIGDNEKGEIAHFESNTDNNSGIWKLDRSVYWPSTMDRLFFIAYTTLTRGESSKNGVLGGATFSVSGDEPTISNFKPVKASLTTTNSQGVWADGEGQKDLLVAFQQQNKGIQTTVDLNFRHALTQVSITAKQNGKADTDHRIVKIKGAWIVNAAKSGTLTATIDVNPDTKEATNKTSWTASDKETYGSYYTDIINLNKDTDKDLLHHTLMLVPQNLTEWNKKSEDMNGAYIMLLCRVELEHEGATHSGADITDIGIIGTDENGKHYHQLFPVNSTYDGAQYGFVCVPFSTDWAERLNDAAEDCKGAGMHYTYNLDICGATSGAGIYPPITKENAQDLIDKLIPKGAKVSALVLNGDKNKYVEQEVALNVVTTRPAVKKIGDNVLDEPIKFSVSVSAWENPDDSWQDGNVSL